MPDIWCFLVVSFFFFSRLVSAICWSFANFSFNHLTFELCPLAGFRRFLCGKQSDIFYFLEQVFFFFKDAFINAACNPITLFVAFADWPACIGETTCSRFRKTAVLSWRTLLRPCKSLFWYQLNQLNFRQQDLEAMAIEAKNKTSITLAFSAKRLTLPNLSFPHSPRHHRHLQNTYCKRFKFRGHNTLWIYLSSNFHTSYGN